MADIDQLLRTEFEIVERSDKGEELLESDRFGYHSIHYLLRLKTERVQLAEYEQFAGALAEVQVRTILQHAWAEIQHDIQYKSSTTIPAEIRRRFMAVAGVLEVADREFQAIQDDDRQLTIDARSKITSGTLKGVEITPDSLKTFLDRKLGPDGRISEWSYDWTARQLQQFGFRDLQQLEVAVSPYNGDQLSHIVWNSRQGQISRFDLMLLAALGSRYVERHPHRDFGWFRSQQDHHLKALETGGIKTGTYDPVPAE